MILALIEEACQAGARLKSACRAINLDPRTVQRWRCLHEDGRSLEDQRHGPRTVPGNALSHAAQKQVLEIINSPEFRDLPPTRIVPLLADRGIYIASESTIYRILRAQRQLAHRGTSRPRTRRRPREQVATGPGQVWSWDITYLRGPVRGRFLYLYLVMDVWSRMIVAAEVHTAESDEIAGRMITAAAQRQNVRPRTLVLHSDNGSPMRGSEMLATLQQLGVTPSFSRPRCSNDNPFSESLFGTLKAMPEYPRHGRFESDGVARQWVDAFVHWYNHIHLHSAIRFVTPADRHHGRERTILEARDAVYLAARERRPERWTGSTRNWTPIFSVRLNPAPSRARTRPAPDNTAGQRHRPLRTAPDPGATSPAGQEKPAHRNAEPTRAPSPGPSPSRGRPGVRGPAEEAPDEARGSSSGRAASAGGSRAASRDRPRTS
jgi:transposase InsO family protein